MIFEPSKGNYQRRAKAYTNLSLIYRKHNTQTQHLVEHLIRKLQEIGEPTEDIEQINEALKNADKRLVNASKYLKQTRQQQRNPPLNRLVRAEATEDILAAIEANLYQANKYLIRNAKPLQALNEEGKTRENE